TYGLVFGDGIEELAERLGPTHDGVLAVRALLRTVSRIPPRRLTGPRSVERRIRGSAAAKEWLRELRRSSSKAWAYVEDRVRGWGGDPSGEAARERLDSLVGRQAYLLSNWRAGMQEVD